MSYHHHTHCPPSSSGNPKRKLGTVMFPTGMASLSLGMSSGGWKKAGSGGACMHAGKCGHVGTRWEACLLACLRQRPENKAWLGASASGRSDHATLLFPARGPPPGSVGCACRSFPAGTGCPGPARARHGGMGNHRVRRMVQTWHARRFVPMGCCRPVAISKQGRAGSSHLVVPMRRY